MRLVLSVFVLFINPEQSDRIGSLAHVVHAQDPGTLPQALPTQGNRAGKRFLGSDSQRFVDHRLARKSRQHRETQVAQAVQAGEQFVVLVHGLGKAETGIEDDLFAADTQVRSRSTRARK